MACLDGLSFGLAPYHLKLNDHDDFSFACLVFLTLDFDLELLQRSGSFNPTMSLDAEVSPNASPASAGSNTPQTEPSTEGRWRRRSFSRKADEVSPMIESFPQFTQAGELFSATLHGRRPPPVRTFCLNLSGFDCLSMNLHRFISSKVIVL